MQKLLVTVILVLTTGLVIAQTPTNDKAELERERREIQNELKEIQGVYNQVKGQTKQSLAQVNMAKRKVELQERLISNTNKELRYIDDDIYLSNIEIYRLEKQLDTLKSQYARTVVYAYKNRSSFDYVNFIFSANSFNDALRRVSYLKSYRQFREKQIGDIKATAELIKQKQQAQIGRKQQKNNALTEQNKQRAELAEQKKEKDAVLVKLKSQEKELQSQIANKKKRDQSLKNAITAIIRREIEAAKKEEQRLAPLRKAEEEKAKAANAAAAPATKPAANSNSTAAAPKTTAAPAPKSTASYLEVNARDEALGNEFSTNRGKLPWPVDRAIVMIDFGPYSIGDKIKGVNPGLTLGTPAGAPVKAVFEGSVAAVYNYGDGMAVTIKHGKYYTTYGNLSNTSVTKGMQVKTGQVIGKAGENEEGNGGQIDFVLMNGLQETNPALWLKR